MRRALLCVVVAVLGLGGVACGGSSSSSAATRTVQVDGSTDKYNGAFLAYFPNSVTVRPGDTVDFHENWTGEPHTVTMGTLVESALKEAQQAGPNGPTPQIDKLPSLLPQGPGDAHQNAAQPCFLPNGAPPDDPATACPKAQQSQPAFDGTQSYYNSGFLAASSNFSVKLSPNTKPGTYSYYCNLHGPEMSGKIVVEAKDAKIPSASDVDKAGTSQKDDLVNKVLPAYNAAKSGNAPLPAGAAKNLAGFVDQNVTTALVDEFIQPTIQAKVGEKVSWTVIGPHTLSFGKSPVEPGQFLNKAPDGAWHLSAQAFAPSGFPAPPESSGPPSATGPQVAPINGGTLGDTTTFKSSGPLIGFGPPFPVPSVTFTKAGTYTYVCLIHPKMGGVVQVS